MKRMNWIFFNEIDDFIFHPVSLFFLVWLGLIALYIAFPVSYFMPQPTVAIAYVVILSVIFFYAGCVSAGYAFEARKKVTSNHHVIYKVSQNRLIIAAALLVCLIIFIVLFNVMIQGFPPLFSGHSYATYGRLKGFMYAMVLALALVSFLLCGKKKRAACLALSVTVLLMYLARGVLVTLIIQCFFMYVYLRKEKVRVGVIKKKRWLFWLCLALVSILIFGLSEMSNMRGQSDVYFKQIMGIRSEYYSYSFVSLWVISYIILPLGNLIEIVEKCNDFTYGVFTFSNSMPAVVNLVGSHDKDAYISLLPNQFSNVSTYLGFVYLDFGWFGVVFFNYVLGLISYVFVQLKGLCFVPMKSIWVSAIMLLFFHNLFFSFSLISEMIIMFCIMKYSLKGYSYSESGSRLVKV